MSWSQFSLAKDKYKSSSKAITMIDRTSTDGETLEIMARIMKTDQTDLEITFYSKHSIVNNTDQHLMYRTKKE